MHKKQRIISCDFTNSQTYTHWQSGMAIWFGHMAPIGWFVWFVLALISYVRLNCKRLILHFQSSHMWTNDNQIIAKIDSFRCKNYRKSYFSILVSDSWVMPFVIVTNSMLFWRKSYHLFGFHASKPTTFIFFSPFVLFYFIFSLSVFFFLFNFLLLSHSLSISSHILRLFLSLWLASILLTCRLLISCLCCTIYLFMYMYVCIFVSSLFRFVCMFVSFFCMCYISLKLLLFLHFFCCLLLLLLYTRFHLKILLLL